MKRKELRAILNQIEEEFDVQSLRFQGMCIWPIIKTLVHDGSFPPVGIEKTKENSIARPSSPLQKMRTFIHLNLTPFRFRKYTKVKDNRTIPKGSVLFLGKTEDRRERYKDHFLDKFLEPLIPYFEKQSPTFLLEYSLRGKVAPNPYTPSRFIGGWSPLFMSLYFIRHKLFGKVKVEGWSSFKEYAQKAQIPLKFDQLKFESRLLQVFGLGKYLEGKLRKLEPRLVLFWGYYSRGGFATTIACRKLGLKCVEIQHGQQGSDHPLYTNWVNFPSKGYELLPDYFWMWSQANARRIESWTKGSSHKVIVGGSPWLNFYWNHRTEIEADSKEKPAFNALVKNYEKRVLIGAQLTEDLKKSFLVEFMQQNRPDILWLIRLHPRHLSQKEALKEFFEGKGCKNLDFEWANATPLFELFNSVDYCITFWSTVAYEADLFGVNSIIIHPNGKEAMKNYIGKKIFAYADSVESLEEALYHFEFQKAEQKYIEYENEVIEKAITQLF